MLLKGIHKNRFMNLKTQTLLVFILVSIVLFPGSPLFSQGVTIGSMNPPDASAVLDIQSTSGGFLPPRMTTVQRNAINTPALGLIVFNTDNECLQSYFSGGWRSIMCNCSVYPSAAFTLSSLGPGVNQIVQATPSNPQVGNSYQWLFQNGSPNSASQQNASTQWSNTGTYSVHLTVTDNMGCAASDSQTVTVTPCLTAQNQQQTFSYTGSPQSFTVPAGICSLSIECWGAQGWTGTNQGGRGGYSTGNLSVTPGQQLHIYVGGQGTVASGNMNPQGGGWNGGGNGQNNGTGSSVGGGGGGSDVRTVLNTNPMDITSLQSRIIVAGGGGGSTNNSNAYGGNGGGNSGQDGGQTSSFHFGKGGTQSQGGDSSGSLGQGGNGGPGMTPWNGGGGGGYYGGGVSTAHSGGGGGSGYIGGVSNGSMQSGIRTGHGQVVIRW